jgi:hypothetical protein
METTPTVTAMIFAKATVTAAMISMPTAQRSIPAWDIAEGMTLK